MKSRLAYYMVFVLCLAAVAIGVSVHLNNVALINHMDVVSILNGENVQHLKATSKFNGQITQQLNIAEAKGADTALVNYFRKVSGNPSHLLVKLQELFIWHIVTDSKNKIAGNSFRFQLRCNPAHPFDVDIGLSKKGEDFYLEEITGFDTVLILAKPGNAHTFIACGLEYNDAVKQIGEQWVQRGIAMGQYDTAIHGCTQFSVTPKPFAEALPAFSTPEAELRGTRDYLYRLIAIAHDADEKPVNIAALSYDTLTDGFASLNFAATCTEHAQMAKRTLDKKFTILVRDLYTDSGQLINHTLNLVYYKLNGVGYAVTVDAMLGIIGPVKQDGSFYRINELTGMQQFFNYVNYPPSIEVKRYTVDTAKVYSNVYHKPGAKFYSTNGHIFYYGFDDLNLLAPELLIDKKMPRHQFAELYNRVLADLLLRNKPGEIKEYKP